MKKKLGKPIFYIFVFLLLILSKGITKAKGEALLNKLTVSENIEIEDTAFINRTITKALQYRITMPDSAMILARKALQLSTNTGYNKGIGNSYAALGLAHLTNYSKNDSAQICLNRSYEIYEGLDDNKGMGQACWGLGYVYGFKGDLKKAEEYSIKSLEYYTLANDKRGMFNAAYSLSYVYRQFKNYNKSFEYTHRAIDYAKSLKDTSIIANAYNELGNIYQAQALFRQAIDNYFIALKMWESVKDSTGMALTYGNIGNMYYYQLSFKKALEYYHLQQPILLNNGNKWEISKMYNNIAGAYNSLKQYDLAIEYQLKSVQLNTATNYKAGIAESYYKLADIYYMKGTSDSALHYIDRSIDMGNKIGIQSSLPDYYLLKGKIYFIRKNYRLAHDNLLKAYKQGEKLNIPFVVFSSADFLQRIYVAWGQHSMAYKYLHESKQMEDSIKNEENIKKITRLEIQYEFEKKKQLMELEKEQEQKRHNEEMKQQRAYLFISIVIALLVIISIIFIIKQKNTKIKYKTISLEQKMLRMQMDPHFIFNSLCAIQEFVLGNKPQKANTFLSKFAGLMRSTLENSRTDFVQLEKEIDALSNYLEVQKIRFETDFDYSIDIDPSIDTSTYRIPPMMAQPFIENAVEHGLLPKKDKGKIEIKYILNNELITIDVKDNGIGREKSALRKKEQQQTKQSLATTVTKERINYLKKAGNKRCFLEIADIHENGNTGTHVIIQVPYRISLS